MQINAYQYKNNFTAIKKWLDSKKWGFNYQFKKPIGALATLKYIRALLIITQYPQQKWLPRQARFIADGDWLVEREGQLKIMTQPEYRVMLKNFNNNNYRKGKEKCK